MNENRCCTAASPVPGNLPGQPALRYRTDVWSSFRAAMIARLPLQVVPPHVSPGTRPLAALTARDPSDPTVALLDAAAVAFDVLTFYQERIVNETYLGTATERVSLVQIARALGYEPGPGVAASGHLAFTVSSVATEPIAVPARTPVMALPEGSAPPPVFETDEAIEARLAWNALPVARRLPPANLARGNTWVWVDGVGTRARPGDGILIYGTDRNSSPGSERWEFRRVASVEPDAAHDQTKLVFERGLGDARTAPPEQALAVLIFRNRASVFGHNAPDWTSQSDQAQLTAWWRAGGSMTNLPEVSTTGLTRLLRRNPPVMEWPKFALVESPLPGQSVFDLDLDREYTGIVPGQWVVLVDAFHVEAYKVSRASPRSRVDFTLASKVTRLRLQGEHLDRFERRATAVWCEPDSFERVGEPDDSAVTGATVRVEGDHANLMGRLLAVYGPDADDGTPRGEVVTVASVAAGGDGTTTLTLDPPLASRYERARVLLNANVARASHGQTAPEEVLGSGDASRPFQRFLLKGRPLTYVSSADDPGGAVSTLTLRVGGVAWTQVPYLHGQAPEARVYALRHASDGSTVVEFGDGVVGARLPTGAENVVAAYRTGLGLTGEVARGRASLLTRRPTGIDAATNPAPFGGSADPEAPEDIRKNAPRTVLTLDRLVSIRDYEDFARAFAGIGKALSVEIWAGQRRLVHLTVASASGASLGPTDETLLSLEKAVRKYQDPVHRVVVDGYDARSFGVEAWLLIEATRVWDDVKAAAEAALAEAFAFDARQFGQGVTTAEVIAVLQAVEGVRAVDLDRIWRIDAPNAPAPPRVFLESKGPSTSGGARQKAELLLLSRDANHVILKRMPQ